MPGLDPPRIAEFSRVSIAPGRSLGQCRQAPFPFPLKSVGNEHWRGLEVRERTNDAISHMYNGIVDRSARMGHYYEANLAVEVDSCGLDARFTRVAQWTCLGGGIRDVTSGQCERADFPDEIEHFFQLHRSRTYFLKDATV